MNLLEEFCRQVDLCIFNGEDIDYVCDDSQFVAVDGEEGDYGIIKYHSKSNELIAVRTIRGGDDEDTEFTEFGKNLLAPLAIDMLKEKIQKLDVTE